MAERLVVSLSIFMSLIISLIVGFVIDDLMVFLFMILGCLWLLFIIYIFPKFFEAWWRWVQTGKWRKDKSEECVNSDVDIESENR